MFSRLLAKYIAVPSFVKVFKVAPLAFEGLLFIKANFHEVMDHYLPQNSILHFLEIVIFMGTFSLRWAWNGLRSIWDTYKSKVQVIAFSFLFTYTFMALLICVWKFNLWPDIVDYHFIAGKVIRIETSFSLDYFCLDTLVRGIQLV